MAENPNKGKFPKASNMYIAKQVEGSQYQFFKIIGTAFVQFEEGKEAEKCFVGRRLDEPEADLEYFNFDSAFIVNSSEMLKLTGFNL